MKKIIHLALIALAMLTLSACSAQTTTNQAGTTPVEYDDDAMFTLSEPLVQGLWEMKEQLYYFAEDGQFISFTDNNLAGGSWAIEDNALVLSTYNASLQIQEDIKLTGTIMGDDMTLVNKDGFVSKWEREDNKVSYIESELYYLERIGLPPEVMVEITLTQNNGTRYLSRSVKTERGTLPLVFRTYYLEENLIKNSPIEIEALVSYENSFLFTAHQSVMLEKGLYQVEPIRLTQPNPEKISELINRLEAPQRELTSTYWKLVQLNAKSIYQNFDTEPHVILHQRGNSIYMGDANGNDGCNSFFATWKIDENSANDLDISLGGSTMRLCNDEMLNLQVRNFMKALDETDTYYIQGSKLILKDDADTIAVFEAVDL